MDFDTNFIIQCHIRNFQQERGFCRKNVLFFLVIQSGRRRRIGGIDGASTQRIGNAALPHHGRPAGRSDAKRPPSVGVGRIRVGHFLIRLAASVLSADLGLQSLETGQWPHLVLTGL